jgi:hypothetical protein
VSNKVSNKPTQHVDAQVIPRSRFNPASHQGAHSLSARPNALRGESESAEPAAIRRWRTRLRNVRIRNGYRATILRTLSPILDVVRTAFIRDRTSGLHALRDFTGVHDVDSKRLHFVPHCGIARRCLFLGRHATVLPKSNYAGWRTSAIASPGASRPPAQPRELAHLHHVVTTQVGK